MTHNPRCFHRHAMLALFAAVAAVVAQASVPQLLNHQGRIAVNGVNFNGNGQFKFALVDAAGTTTYWSNDGTSSTGSQPAAAVTLPVTRGLYAVLLGDSSLPNMAELPATALDHPAVLLRIWFNDGSTGFQQIAPDQRLAAAAYALVASRVEQVRLGDVLAPPAQPVLAWGRNTNGQTTVPTLENVAAIAAGETYSLALLKTGTVVSWGLADPVPPTLSGVTHLAAGAKHSLARKSNGTVVAWGDDTYGQSTVPGGITTAATVAAGEKHSLVLLANGTVRAWGNNDFNQTTVPGTATNITAIASGYDHNLALTASGTVIAWGRNDASQSAVPADLANVVAIAAGAYHSLAVKSDGTVVAWGWDQGGQSTVPPGLTGVAKVAAGYSFSVALKNDGTLVTWGDPAYQQTSPPAAATSVTNIAAGAGHALALRAELVPAQVARLDGDNVFTGRLGIQRTPATNALEVQGNASKSTAGNWLANSDRRIKTDIEPLTGALAKLNAVRLVDFRYTAGYLATHPGIEDRRYPNVIAQEFAEVFPDAVKSSGELLADGSPILQVDTYPLTIYAAAAVQELHRENLDLKQRLAEQEQRLRKLEALLPPP